MPGRARSPACGSARILADLIDERQPDIDPTPYSPITANRHRSIAA
jgi:D-amino-acid dehydrogenase